MKPFTRTASAVWQGSHQHGEGAITTQSAILKKAPYASGRLGRGNGTNPPELIAAAHASSFSMALANELRHAGYCPEQIDATATVTMELIAAGWTMTGIHLDVIAWVPRAPQCDFIDAAVRAKTSCSISRLLHAKVSMFAKLKRRAAATPLSREQSRRVVMQRLNNERKPTMARNAGPVGNRRRTTKDQ